MELEPKIPEFHTLFYFTEFNSIDTYKTQNTKYILKILCYY